jgi:hypothetical protein
LLELTEQDVIHNFHTMVNTELGEARDAMIEHSAGYDASVMGEVGAHVEACAMQADAATDTQTDGGDLVFTRREVAGSGHPNANPIAPTFACDTELGQAANEPILNGVHEGSHIASVALHVEHNVDHALARTVVGQ